MILSATGRVLVQSFYHLQRRRECVDMQKEKVQIVNRKKDSRGHQLQSSLTQFNKHHDPLWDQTPEMGAEGLIATVDSKRELQKALKKGIMERKKRQRGALLIT